MSKAKVPDQGHINKWGHLLKLCKAGWAIFVGISDDSS